MDQLAKKNRTAMTALFCSQAFVFLGYVMQVIYPHPENPMVPLNLLQAFIFPLICNILIVCIYKKNRELLLVRNLCLLSLLGFVTIILYLQHNLLLYVVALPIMIVFSYYDDRKFIIYSCTALLIINVLSVVYNIFTVPGYTDTTSHALFQIATSGFLLYVLPHSVKFINETHNIALGKEQEQTKYIAELLEESHKANETVMESISYASKIQKNLLPDDSVFEVAFSDYSIIWKPRDIVGGDIYWAKNFDDGMVLCVADCTGHGTPGALLTMLVVSAFESIIKEKRRKDTAEILYFLDRRLATVLNVKNDGSTRMRINDGCDLAVLFIANDGSITMSSGHTSVFACDGNTVTRYKGQEIYVGDGTLTGKKEVQIVNIPANPKNKFYIASDGMSGQIGGEQKRQFGYKIFEQTVLENHNEKLSVISDRIWDAFEEYRGEEVRRDDFELITFKPKMS